MDYGNQKLAAWDSRQEYCHELSILRKALHQARIDRNTEQRFLLLESYFLALAARMKKKNGLKMMEAHEEHYKNIKKDYSDWIKTKKIGNLNIKFMNWELALRRDEDDLNLLMPNKHEYIEVEDV